MPVYIYVMMYVIYIIIYCYVLTRNESHELHFQHQLCTQ